MVRVLSFIMIFHSLAGFAAETPPAKAGLVRLVELAEEHSPVIRQRKLALEQSQLELKNATAMFFPVVNLESTHGLTDKYPDPDRWTTNARSKLALTATEKFYDNGASITKYKQASALRDYRRIEYEHYRDEHLLKLAHLYYNWSSRSQDRQISNNKRDLLRRQFNMLEAWYKQGLKTKRDVLRIETEVRKLQIELLRKDNDLEKYLEDIAAMSGLSREDLRANGIGAEEALLTASIDSGPWAELKLADHRHSKLADLDHKYYEFGSRLVEREYWPTISLEGKVFNINENYIDMNRSFGDTRTWGWETMLTINYNIFDGWTRNRNVQIARIAEKNAQAKNQQTLLNLNVELRDVVLRLNEYSESAKLTKELLGIEQQSYNILEAEYRNGRATYLDLITNLNSLIDARLRFASTYFELKKQQTTYAFHKGSLYETLKGK